MQVVANLTDLPLHLPLSFCLPKECDSKHFFMDLVKKLEAKTNELLVPLKEKFNFNNMSEYVGVNHYDA